MSSEAAPKGAGLGSLKKQSIGAKAFECKILPITPLDGRFCEAKFFPALCFQYFADEMGEGG